MSDEVLVSRDGPVVTLTFNRPQARNAMTWEMYERLYQTCEEVDAADGVRAFGVDPGLTVTERMEAAGRAEVYRKHFAAATPDVIGRAIRWLVTDPEADGLRGTVVQAQSEARRRAL